MVESGVERTPLLMDSRSPPRASPLSRSYVEPSASTRRLVGAYPARRSLSRRSQVHPLHKKSLTASSSSYRQQFPSTTSSSPQFASSLSAPTTSSSSASHQTISVPIYNKIWQIVVSLPHHLLCFASPICSPVCGLCCCFTCIRTSEYGVMQRFGKFERIMHPGLHVMKWPMER